MLVIEQMKAKENFTNLERQITDYILKHRKEVLSLSLKDLAQSLYMSKATIIRYYKKLGFSSYREMCVELTKELSLYHDYDEARQSDSVLFNPDDSIEEIAEKILLVKTNALTVTHEYLDVKTIKQIQDVIHHYNRIYIYGFGSGGSIGASNLEVKLVKSGLDATRIEYKDWYAERYKNYTKNACMILIGYNDSDNRIMKLAQKVKQESIPIILLTGPYKNEIDQYAYLILRTYYTEEKSVPFSLGSTTALEYLTSVLFTVVSK